MKKSGKKIILVGSSFSFIYLLYGIFLVNYESGYNLKSQQIVAGSYEVPVKADSAFDFEADTDSEYIIQDKEPYFYEVKAEDEATLSSFGHPKPELRSLFESAIFKNFLTVVVANNGQKEFLMNWIIAFKKNITQGSKSFLVVALDDKTLQWCQKEQLFAVHIQDLILGDSLKWKPELEQEQNFTAPDYNLLVNSKIAAVHTIVKYYRQRVIFCDIDIVLMNPGMMEYFEEFLEPGVMGYELLLIYDHWQVGHHYGTGFYVITPTDFTIRFLEDILRNKVTEDHDQSIANHLISILPPVERLKIYILPIVFFQNGQSSQMDYTGNFGIKPWMAHANWRIGNAAKMEYLKTLGLWFVS